MKAFFSENIPSSSSFLNLSNVVYILIFLPKCPTKKAETPFQELLRIDTFLSQQTCRCQKILKKNDVLISKNPSSFSEEKQILNVSTNLTLFIRILR